MKKNFFLSIKKNLIDIEEVLLRRVLEHLLAELFRWSVSRQVEVALAQCVDQVAPEQSAAALRFAALQQQFYGAVVLLGEVVRHDLLPVSTLNLTEQPNRILTFKL